MTIIPEWLGLCTSNPVQLFTKILKIVPVTFGLSEKNNFCICEFKTDHKRLKKSHNKSLERPANSAVRIFSPYEHDRGNHFRWLIPGRRSL
ncbi:hypothetical protein D3OALGA1CA_5480 [Olavius algarvensis associated proteobacterium Delta 3]|nr:hypothetical protein D3OALGA1CA_5480 [Olavius algarvensis associated proteobacterium Delta 3]